MLYLGVAAYILFLTCVYLTGRLRFEQDRVRELTEALDAARIISRASTEMACEAQLERRRRRSVIVLSTVGCPEDMAVGSPFSRN